MQVQSQVELSRDNKDGEFTSLFSSFVVLFVQFTFISLHCTQQPYRKPLLLTTIKVMVVSLYTGNHWIMGKIRGGKGRGMKELELRNAGHCCCKAIICLYKNSNLVNICSRTLFQWVWTYIPWHFIDCKINFYVIVY